MKRLALLISPRAKSAYFNDYLKVSQAELAWQLGNDSFTHRTFGSMDFFELDAEPSALPQLARLSFVQGIFECQGDALLPLDIGPKFNLHEDFVFGSKFKGKTNETLTQMLINVGLASIDADDLSQIKLLDPMCGRATTLLWAMRYGINAKGIEQDPKALAEIQQNTKKWCKVHRQKHKFTEGLIGGKSLKQNKKQTKGRFIDFAVEQTEMRVICGDSTDTENLLKREKFDLMISDLPYGVQHFTTTGTRNPLEVLSACADGWKACLKPGGVIVLAFNKNIPKRPALIDMFAEHGLVAMDFEAPHRMSESIVRDVVVLRHAQ